MKKMLLTLVIALAAVLNVQAMSRSNIRNNARFISDRMAYELDLAPWQYEECYEINYDFIYAINYIMDDVVFGYYDAIDHYYDLLDDRNDDLRYVLNASQYRKFMTRDYFYRPVYTSGTKWSFRIYTIYSNRTFFYYDAPRVLKTYRGEHSRSHHTTGYYASRRPANNGSRHDIYQGNDYRIKGSQNHQNHSRNDFGANRVQRPQNGSKPQRDNYYKNPNQKNRDKDHRYHDNSGNTQSPQINHTQQGNNNQHGGQQGNNSQPHNQRGQQGNNGNNNQHGQQGGNSQHGNSGTPSQPQSHRR